MCTIIGYSLILSFVVSIFIFLLSIPVLAEMQSNGIPKVNVFKEYFLYPFICYISCFIFIVLISCSYFVVGTGLSDKIKGLSIHLILENFILFVLCMTIFCASLASMHVYLGVDILVTDFMFLMAYLIGFYPSFARFSAQLKKSQRRLTTEIQSETESLKTKPVPVVKSKQGFACVFL